MNDLLLFHKQVESVLENLTDESQVCTNSDFSKFLILLSNTVLFRRIFCIFSILKVLARFEGFPIKKLETLRIAAALYLKLDTIVYQLQNWKFVSPMGLLLDRVENYFSKVVLNVYLDLFEALRIEFTISHQPQPVAPCRI